MASTPRASVCVPSIGRTASPPATNTRNIQRPAVSISEGGRPRVRSILDDLDLPSRTLRADGRQTPAALRHGWPPGFGSDKKAVQLPEKAQSAAPRPGRAIADEGRQQKILAALSVAREKLQRSGT